MFRNLCSLTVVATGLLGPLAVAQEAQVPYSVKVVLDREEAIYKTGEKATFEITVWKGKELVKGEGTLTLAADDFLSPKFFPKGKVAPDDKSTQVVAMMITPGVLRLQATFKPKDGKVVRSAIGAAFSPKEIGLSLPVPDDFDEFWTEQKKQLAKIRLDPKLTPIEHANAELKCFDVQVPCLGGTPVSGYFSKPKTAKPKTLPAILWVHGAGVRSSSLGNAVKGARSGMLSMDINAHGIPNGKPKEYYADLYAGRLKGYRYFGRESRDTSYFRGMYLRIVRAVDFLTSQPEWDGKHVVVIGHSQGGGQAIVAGGLDDRVTMIATGVPAICDHSGREANRINGWPKLVPYGDDGTPNSKVLEAARYVDAVNFATRCKAEAIMSVGFIDSVCPPSSCFAAYNALLGKKSIINEPSMGHAAPAHIQNAFFEAVLKHVGLQPDESVK